MFQQRLNTSGGVLLALLVVVTGGAVLASQSPQDRSHAVEAVLADYHRAIDEGDLERHFAHLAPDVVVIGTDPAEVFTMEKYRAWIEPHASGLKGRMSKPVEQRVFVSEDGKMAWFEERLDKPGFGELRATGVLRLQDGDWKIVQFHTAIPVPNELARDLMGRIEAFVR